MKTDLTWTLLVLLAIAVNYSPATAKKEKTRKPNGAKIFAQYCSNCHFGGANLLKERHPVANSKELSTLATFKSYLRQPPGHMPHYQEIVDNQQVLEALYKFCKALKGKSIKQS